MGEKGLPRLHAPRVPCAPHESDPGHTYRLARSLSEADSGADRKPLPDGTYVPVPDRVLDSVDDLSGCAARLCLLMIRASYGWDEDLEEFRASSRWHTARQIEEQAGGLGMSPESLRRAAGELEERGWIEQRKREGCATAYRWALSVPKRRYTPVPAPLLHAHQGLSHSALTLYLSVIRATLGWAEKENGEITYGRVATLTTPNLEKMTGLSRPTVREAQAELRAKSALYIRREHAGAPYEFAVDFSFFRHHLQKSYPSTNCEKNSNQHTRTRKVDSENDPIKRRPQGRFGADQVTEDWEREAIRFLCSDSVGMDRWAARKWVIRFDKTVVERTLKAFRQQREDIRSPAGWLFKAFEEHRYVKDISKKTPNVRQSSSSEPIAKAFQALTEKREGWEWDEDESESESGGDKNFGGGPGGLDTGPTAGVSHSEMCDLVGELGKGVDAGDFETVERKDRNPLWVPSKELANRAYRLRNSGSDRFQEAARRVVTLRARHEGRPSPIAGQ